jgi:transposase
MVSLRVGGFSSNLSYSKAHLFSLTSFDPVGEIKILDIITANRGGAKMLKPEQDFSIPKQTVRVARAAFPKGSLHMQIRDEIGRVYKDDELAELYPEKGQPAINPWRLAMVTVMQYVENLSDRQAADAVRGRIDWKYALGLELEDAGFDFSVLSEFRQRLIDGGKETVLLERLLERIEACGLLKGKHTQRTDATHVIARIRRMNRLEMVGETVRRVLNDMALVAPEWLRGQLKPAWVERYGRRFDAYRLPKSKAKQQALAAEIGRDGYGIMMVAYQENAPADIRDLISLEILRRIWVQQYCLVDDEIHWRTKKQWGHPPSHQMIASPDDLDARYGGKRSMFWTGYKVHLTETCEPGQPHLITQVETTPATTNDVTVTKKIQADLAEKDCLPKKHLVDGGYVDLEVLIHSQDNGIDLIGPIAKDRSWQAKLKDGFDHAKFQIDWQNRQATCPQGKQSIACTNGHSRSGNPNSHFHFSIQDCQPCQVRSRCTKAKKAGRQLCVFPPEQYQLLQDHRQRQETDQFKLLYQARAGIEGTVSQAVNSFGVRYTRYHGLAKTHLQNLATSAAINFTRVADWLSGYRPETTRVSPLVALARQT